jgi:S1-C subfamily serine protease
VSLGAQELPPGPQGGQAAVQQESLTAEEVFKRAAPSVFVLEDLDKSGSVVAFGSAVVWAKDQVVTNKHVIEAGTLFRLRRGDRAWPAKVTHIDPQHDLAMLSADGLDAPLISIRSSGGLAVGERVYAIGAPEGLELTLSESLISGLRELDGELLVQTSAAISHGSSGGGLFDRAGRLVGITTAFLRNGQNLNFAVPAELIQNLQRYPWKYQPPSVIDELLTGTFSGEVQES